MNNSKNTNFIKEPLTSFQRSRAALALFAKELKDAGGFDELMLKKNAIERVDGHTLIFVYHDIERYKDLYLNGIYRPLRPYFNTKVPYSFWSQLYMAVKKNGAGSK